jgi:two-component system chemotaxis sensor kinase CheA
LAVFEEQVNARGANAMTTEQTNTADAGVDELFQDFVDEASQLLDRLNEDLLVLDEWVRSNTGAPCDERLMNNMFRSAHSIKGLSAMLGLSHVNKLTHCIENVFDAARKNELPLARPVVQTIFEAVDKLTAMVSQIRTEGNDNVDATGVLAGIARILQSSGCERQATTQADAERALQMLTATNPTNAAAPTTDSSRTAMTTTPAAPRSRAIDHFSTVADDAGFPSKYIGIFIDETEMSLDSMTESLVSFDTGDMAAAVENLLITSHRIKGSAASVGLHRPAKLAHLMEDVLQELLEAHAPLSSNMADVMLQCTDALRLYVAGLKTGQPTSDDFNRLANELLFAHADAVHPANLPVEPKPVVATIDHLARVKEYAEQFSTYGQVVVGMVRFIPGLALAGLKAQLILEKLQQAGEVLVSTPPTLALEDIDTLDCLTFAVATEATVDVIKSKVFIAGVKDIQTFVAADMLSGQGPTPAPAKAPAAAPTVGPVVTIAAPVTTASAVIAEHAAEPEAAKARTATPDTSKPNETLRVDIERLDQLMNLAGQLVINKARFAQIGEGLKETLVSKQTPQRLANAVNLSRKLLKDAQAIGRESKPSAELESLRSTARRLANDLEAVQRELSRVGQMRSRVNDLFEAVHQLDRVSDGIQKSVMDTRMVPIGPLFGRFKRVVRDITRLNNKEVELVIRGEKTELDKRMIDELGDPLIHMVRNAADHGVELPVDRLAADKPPHGTLTLDAYHRGNSIIIQVSDDGKGLDKDRILAKAIEKKIISAAEAEKMTPQQAYQLIWEPGFSTAEKVTEISGRGMGMDIVRSKIEEISGTVEVDSRPGHGTTFTIKLPLTLAILPSLMADIDGDVFALPIESIVEIVSVPRASLATVHGERAAIVRGRVVSVVELDELFTWNPREQETVRESADCTLVIIGQEGQEIGLRVDTLLGEEDVVIKSMAENYRNVAGIAGASILGDGRVSLILDVTALIALSSRQATLV